MNVSLKARPGLSIEAYTPDLDEGWANRTYEPQDIVKFLASPIKHSRWSLRQFILALDTPVGRTVFALDRVDRLITLAWKARPSKKVRPVFQKYIALDDSTCVASTIRKLVPEEQHAYPEFGIGDHIYSSLSYTPIEEFIDSVPIVGYQHVSAERFKTTVTENRLTVMDAYMCIFDDLCFHWQGADE